MKKNKNSQYQKMTGYALSRAWFDFSFANPDKCCPAHAALYLWLVEKWNRCGQPTKFQVTTSESMAAVGMKSRHTHSKIFEDLNKFGFIKVVKKSKNQWQCNVISLLPGQKINTQKKSKITALDRALIQANTLQENSTVPHTCTINKSVTLNKENINKKNTKQHKFFFDKKNDSKYSNAMKMVKKIINENEKRK